MATFHLRSIRNRTTTSVLGCVMGVVLICGGCPSLQPDTSAELVNNTSGNVRVRIFYSSEQDVPEDLLETLGDSTEIDLAAGETRVFSRDCDALQALLVHGELDLIGNLGPEESTRVYRDGSDFGCGDRLVFRFTQDLLGTDLDISVAGP